MQKGGGGEDGQSPGSPGSMRRRLACSAGCRVHPFHLRPSRVLLAGDLACVRGAGVGGADARSQAPSCAPNRPGDSEEFRRDSGRPGAPVVGDLSRTGPLPSLTACHRPTVQTDRGGTEP